MAEDDDFPFEELPEEVSDVMEPVEADAREIEDEGETDYLPIALVVQSVNQRVTGDNKIETQVNARLLNEMIHDGLKVRCNLSLNLESAPDKMPNVTIGNIIDVMV